MNKKSNDYLLSLGSVFASLGAILATSCCIIPLILANLGLGGVWIAKLAVLQPYRVYLLVGAAFLSGAGGLLYIRNRLKSCEVCPPKSPLMKVAV